MGTTSYRDWREKKCLQRMAFPSSKKICGIENLDCISELPEPLILDIISRLPVEDSMRASVLSTTWKGFCGLYPILHFDHNIFALHSLVSTNEGVQEPDLNHIRDMFMDDVDYRLSKATQLNSPIRKLTLAVSIFDPVHFSRVDTWLELAKQINVEDMCVLVQIADFWWEEITFSRCISYEFPISVLASKGLRSLNVRGCKLKLDGDQINARGAPFFSLQRLCLSYVYMDESVLESLISLCQGIETLVLEQCTINIDFLKLSEFPKLKKAVIVPDSGLEYVDIVGTNLEYFTCDAHINCYVSPEACAGIRELDLGYCIINQSYLFKDLAASFPLVEELTFYIFYIDTLKAASSVLRKFVCRSPNTHHVKEVHIDCPSLTMLDSHAYGVTDMYVNCPKLRQFRCQGSTVPKRLFFSSTADLEKSVCSFKMIDAVDTLWFTNLRAFLEPTMANTTTIYLEFASPMVTFKPEEVEPMQASQRYNVLLRLDLFNLQIQDVSALVDCTLWMIRPTTLIFVCYCHHLTKYLCESLSKKSEDKICDEQLTHPCWIHELEDFQVQDRYCNPIMKENLAALPQQCTSMTDLVRIKFQWLHKGVYEKSQECYAFP